MFKAMGNGSATKTTVEDEEDDDADKDDDKRGVTQLWMKGGNGFRYGQWVRRDDRYDEKGFHQIPFNRAVKMSRARRAGPRPCMLAGGPAQPLK